MDRDTIIANLVEYRKHLERELETTDTALAGYGVQPDAQSAASNAWSTAPESAEAKPRVSRRKKSPRGDGRPFEPKYDEPARVSVGRILEGCLPDGLGFREIRDRLKGEGKEYADQALRAAIKGEVKKGRLRRAKAPRDSPFQYLFFAVEDRAGGTAGAG